MDSDGGRVAVVTPGSPVFQAINGKRIGQEFSFREMSYKVLDIIVFSIKNKVYNT